MGVAVFDADGHIGEDFDEIRRRMPRGLVPENPQSPFSNVFPRPLIHHAAQPIELPPTFGTGTRDQWEEFLDFIPIERAVLYPTLGLPFGYIRNRYWAVAACRAYNDWLHDTYTAPPSRLVGMAILPLQNPQAAAEELERAVTELGMAGGVLPATGLAEPLGAPQYAPVYAAADRLGCALAVHGGIHLGLGLDHFGVFAAVNALGHPMAQMVAFADIATNGIFDRYPNVRIAFLEGGAAWLEAVIERLDRAWDTQPQQDPDGSLWQLGGQSATEYISALARDGRLFIGCEGDERAVADLTEILGTNIAMFSSDFPHEVSMERCKHEIHEIATRKDLDEVGRNATLRDNAARLYGLESGDS